nr:sulfotransferase family 2 domain-containing protein [Halomonas sp. KX33721]
MTFVFFVAREPIGRVVSGFLNQVVTKIDRSYPEMFDQLEAATQKPVYEITFRDFVLEYLVKSDWSKVNAHFLPMSECLAPLYYDAAIDIDSLYESAVVLFGQDFAGKNFKKKINSTSESVADEFINLTDINSLDLFHKVKSEKKYPDKKCFIDDEIATVLSKIYAKDIEVYSEISGGSPFKHFDNRMNRASK